MDNQWTNLSSQIKDWSRQLGFSHTGISDIALEHAEGRLGQWLGQKFHGEMAYMARHGSKRSHPEELVPGTIRVITVRLDYLPESMSVIWEALEQTELGYVSRYALGRDYHKIVRNRLQKLADKINEEINPLGYRAFCDSAPVMEKALAEKSGIGWMGKHTNLLSRDAGSWYFLGELFVDIPLHVDGPVSNHCGSCRACIDICPTQAIVEPYQLDARRCISYLTIELHGSIPVEFRPHIGNRIYGCDDCQLVCPWNRYAKLTAEPDFSIRHPLHNQNLTVLFGWDQPTFLKNTEGSAVRRIGYQRWLRNIAVALGNAPTTSSVIDSLRSREQHPSEQVREHVQWALNQHLANQLED